MSHRAPVGALLAGALIMTRSRYAFVSVLCLSCAPLISCGSGTSAESVPLQDGGVDAEPCEGGIPPPTISCTPVDGGADGCLGLPVEGGLDAGPDAIFPSGCSVTYYSPRVSTCMYYTPCYCTRAFVCNPFGAKTGWMEQL